MPMKLAIFNCKTPFDLYPLGFLDFGLLDFLETLVIAGVLVGAIVGFVFTYAIRAGVGILFLLLINFIIRLFGFTTIDFILSAILDAGILAVFIIFQPEIRGLLYRIGQIRRFDYLVLSPALNR